MRKIKKQIHFKYVRVRINQKVGFLLIRSFNPKEYGFKQNYLLPYELLQYCFKCHSIKYLLFMLIVYFILINLLDNITVLMAKPIFFNKLYII